MKQCTLLQLASNLGKTNGAPSRVQDIFNNNWDEKMKVIKCKLFLNMMDENVF